MHVKYYGTLFIWHQTIIIAFAGLVAASFLFYWVPIEVLRYIAIIIIAAQVWLENKNGQGLFITSPPFLLSCISLFFFSFLQGMTVYLSEIPTNDFVNSVGSDAERYIAAFAMIILIMHASVVLYINTNPATEQFIQIKRTSYLSIIFIFLIIILTIANVIYFYSPFDQAMSYYRTLRFLSPPLQAFMLVYLIRQGIGRGGKFKALLALVFFISFSGMLSVHEGKIPIFIAMAASLYWLRLANVSIKRVILIGIIFVMLGIGGVHVMQSIRTPHDSLKSSEETLEATAHMFQKILVWKTMWRQTDTVNCLKNAISTHRGQPFILSKQFFWLKGLVPRVIWPEKPSLSLGQDYSTRYCGFPSKGTHSSSITLLGQPVIHGDWVGLFIHVGILVAGLGGLAWLGQDPRSLSSASIAALLPWLVDFDQDFAMYVANAGKFFLVVLPLIFIAGLSERNQSAWRLTKMLGLQTRQKP